MIYKSHFTFLLLITFFRERNFSINNFIAFSPASQLWYKFSIFTMAQWEWERGGKTGGGHFCAFNINLLPFDRIVHKKRINVAHKSWYLHKIFLFSGMEHTEGKKSIRSQFVSLFLLFTTSQLSGCWLLCLLIYDSLLP
jgi:hypothetical protein